MKNGKNKTMMNREFVTLEIAQELKELGFDEQCFAAYQDSFTKKLELFFKSSEQRGATIWPNVYKKYCHQNRHIIQAPLYQQVFQWFREKKHLIASISTWDSGEFHYTIKNLTGLIHERHCALTGMFDNYESAQNSCIENLIKIIKEDLEISK